MNGKGLYAAPSVSIADVSADLIPSNAWSSETLVRSSSEEKPGPSNEIVSGIREKNSEAVTVSMPIERASSVLNAPWILPTSAEMAPCSSSGKSIS